MKQSKSKIKGIIEAKKKYLFGTPTDKYVRIDNPNSYKYKPKTAKYKGINIINFKQNGKKHVDIIINQDEFATEKKAEDYGNKIGHKFLNTNNDYPIGTVRVFNTFDNSTTDIEDTIKEIKNKTKGKSFSVKSLKKGKTIDHHQNETNTIHSLGMKYRGESDNEARKIYS